MTIKDLDLIFFWSSWSLIFFFFRADKDFATTESGFWDTSGAHQEKSLLSFMVVVPECNAVCFQNSPWNDQIESATMETQLSASFHHLWSCCCICLFCRSIWCFSVFSFAFVVANLWESVTLCWLSIQHENPLLSPQKLFNHSLRTNLISLLFAQQIPQPY